MSLVALAAVDEELAEDVFFTFRVLSEGGEAHVPPCFIMVAAREMGYYPTSPFLRSCLLDVTGRSKRLTYPLFLQLCSALEPTRALSPETVAQCKRAFDIRGSGTLNRSEFRTILASSAAADVTSSEVEAIVELLDPTHTDVIQLYAVQLILLRYLARDAAPCDDVGYTPRSARAATRGAAAAAGDPRLRPLAPNLGDGAPKSGLRVAGGGRGRCWEEAGPRGAAGDGVGGSSRSSRGRGSATQARQQTSPAATAPDDASEDAPKAAPSFPPPKTPVPSPCTSGPVTRATSLQQSLPLRERHSARLETSAPRSEAANRPSLLIDGVEKTCETQTPPSLPPPDICRTLQRPDAKDGKVTWPPEEGVPSVLHESRLFGSHARETLPEVPLEQLREVPVSDPCSVSNTSGAGPLQDDGAAAVARFAERQPTQGPQGAADENTSASTATKRKRKVWSCGCCAQS
ncbi:mucin-associated surface protein (MASP) [Trypanosoma conorhini]|uniref:Mucin-associated surface protein (MASP) n=1 Tax=Trypanosoma conorhini TaxID=83891 RepID=A0A3R7MHQ1_9TRYP|nr:mucin-associated surface protein (MASP) [Trypanosoma conorhini]RNF06093.1 mucin-associated surface protein (MASP) [Trypanosoma conorhini]